MKKKEEALNNELVEKEEGTSPKPRRFSALLNTAVNALLVIAIVLAALCTYTSFVSTSGNGVPSILGVRVFSIQTESMYPTLEPGDLILGTGVKDSSTLREGDIITYWTVINGERVLNTHRIMQIYDGNGFLIFETKGDKNTAVDALTVHESEIVAKYTDIRLPGVGKVFDYLQTSTGFLIVVVIPVFLFFLFHLVQFFRVLFEYQNVKNRIRYEQERGKTEEVIAEQQRKMEIARMEARAAMEAELRERLKAELLASMAPQAGPAAPAAPVEQKEEPAEVKPEPAAEAVEETPAEEPAAEEAPAEEPAAEETQKPAEKKPEIDEAAIEALIAKQREAIEAQLRAKILAEMNQTKTEEKAEETAQI